MIYGREQSPIHRGIRLGADKSHHSYRHLFRNSLPLTLYSLPFEEIQSFVTKHCDAPCNHRSTSEYIYKYDLLAFCPYYTLLRSADVLCVLIENPLRDNAHFIC